MTDRPEHDDPTRYAELTGFEGDWRDLWWNRDFIELMLQRLRVPADASVLDAGCGAGHWGRTLVPHLGDRATLTGVDREPHFVELARDQAAHRGLASRTRYLEAHVTALPFADHTFDLVTCQTLLIHVDAVEAALAELRRVCKPGGVVVAVEPDNLAGNVALLGGDPALADEDIAAIVQLQLRCDAGKRALGEGDNRVGARLPGLLAAAGLHDVQAFTNDRCICLFPPYEGAAMKTQLEQELQWSAQGISILLGTQREARRLFLAGGGAQTQFNHAWQAMRRWMETVREEIDGGRYHATRGFVMVLACGRA